MTQQGPPRHQDLCEANLTWIITGVEKAPQGQPTMTAVIIKCVAHQVEFTVVDNEVAT